MLLAISSVAGCLVDEADVPEIKNRSTDTFRTLLGGEFYDYRVFGQVTTAMGTSSSFEGTLHVDYTLDSLANPLNVGGTVPVIREDSTLTLGATVYSLTRFLQQDLTGTIYVLAVRVGGIGGTLYRTGENTILNNPHPISILTSPVPSSTSTLNNLEYQYMQNCESPNTSCSGVVQTIRDNTISYQGDAVITTFDGRFNTLRIDYDGLFLGPSAPTLFDLRGACDYNTATFFGSTYVFPEVGVVFIDTSCTAVSGGGHRYTASLTNTNVPIP